MSASLWNLSLASADGLLTTEECSILLDVDVFDDDDLLKSFPSAAPKAEAGKFQLLDESLASLYPPSPPSPPDTKPSRADLANDLLQQLDNQCKQENNFPYWLEEKVELPMFEPVPAAAERVPVAQALAAAGSAPPTEELLREFECVLDAVELTHLTPPQSPPGPATQLLLSYAQHAAAPEPWPATAAADVDELVRRRAAELASPPSAGSCSPASPSSDDDWAPAGAGRGSPYARAPDERRSRKKEQNKNAATRYRQKKKQEIEVLASEETALQGRHGELGERCADLQREIRYLKGLMRDLFKAKGLIK